MISWVSVVVPLFFIKLFAAVVGSSLKDSSLAVLLLLSVFQMSISIWSDLLSRVAWLWYILLFLSRIFKIYWAGFLLTFSFALRKPSETPARSDFLELIVSRLFTMSTIETLSELVLHSLCDCLKCSAVGTLLFILAVERPLSVLSSKTLLPIF